MDSHRTPSQDIHKRPSQWILTEHPHRIYTGDTPRGPSQGIHKADPHRRSTQQTLTGYPYTEPSQGLTVDPQRGPPHTRDPHRKAKQGTSTGDPNKRSTQGTLIGDPKKNSTQEGFRRDSPQEKPTDDSHGGALRRNPQSSHIFSFHLPYAKAVLMEHLVCVCVCVCV